MPFKDSKGIKGVPAKAPLAAKSFAVKSSPRSLSKVKMSLPIEFIDGYFKIDLSNVVCDKIKINQKNALDLSYWIQHVTLIRRRK